MRQLSKVGGLTLEEEEEEEEEEFGDEVGQWADMPSTIKNSTAGYSGHRYGHRLG